MKFLKNIHSFCQLKHSKPEFYVRRTVLGPWGRVDNHTHLKLPSRTLSIPNQNDIVKLKATAGACVMKEKGSTMQE